MDIPELPRRIHILGEEAPAVHSISYHTCWPLHTALKKALHDDEYEELKESKLGELTSFWEMLGVHVEAGPSTQEIIAAFERCEGWSRDDRKRLAVKVLMGRTREGRACRRINVQMCPQMLVPRKINSGTEPCSIGQKSTHCFGFTEGDARYQEKKDDALTLCRAKSDLPTSRLHIDAWINVLRKRYNANPQHFRSERMCFLDHLFAQQRRFNYKDFKDSEPDQNYLGDSLVGRGIIMQALYHHFANRKSISPEELNVAMKPFLYMVPYLIVECASSDEQHAQYSLEPFTYERLTNIPQVRAGDCGVYALKYIECHALGMPLSKKDFAKPNGKTMRDKMAVDIFKELPDAHEFENKDNDANMGARLTAVPKRKGGRLVGLARRASSYPASSSQAPYADPMILEELHDKDERIGALEEQNTTILSENATIRSENATILAELASQKKFNTEIMQKLDRLMSSSS
ncbi:hypothetical protein F2Q70_00026572 [Brassica cretica]|uniref:Ubiquitin-like protease family profile domain-containing protein n=1 Tax=Brassica cretica TaxID=69181 RepID=A0A8S9LC91_BRACR|nr:hypothetical protein F2Q70_00026572 [Brassica cretica]